MEKAPQRVMIAGAHITGGFDVKSSKLLCPLELTDCVFDKSPNLDQANARNITLKGCTFPGLRGWELKVEHDFSLEDSSSSNLVDLCGAQIGGQVDLKGVTLSAPGPEVLKLNGLVVQREMRWSGMTTHGQVTMIGARVSKQFICIGTTLVNAGGIALLAQGIKVGSSAYMKSGFSASGEVDISGAEITGRLDCRNGTFRSAGLEQGALRADGIHIENDLICENGFFGGRWRKFVGCHYWRVSSLHWWKIYKPWISSYSRCSCEDFARFLNASEGFEPRGKFCWLAVRLGEALNSKVANSFTQLTALWMAQDGGRPKRCAREGLPRRADACGGIHLGG